MKLLNQSISLISASLLAIVGLWGVVFYYNLIEEIKASVDEGLDNYRRQIIFQAQQDTVLLKHVDFNEGFYAIQEITREEALQIKDEYADTLMFISKGVDYQEEEPFRMLRTAFEDDGHYYRLRVINSMVEKDDLINQTFRNLLFLYLLLIVSIVIINNLVLRKVWSPFYNLLEQLKNYRIGKSDKIPVVKTKTTEFNDLQAAVQTLLLRTNATYEQQKEFIGNAAHELQTPLAIALNRLELLAEKGELKEDQIADVGETMHIVERLIRLNKSLLLLSKIENRQFLGNEEITVNEVVKNGVEELSEIAEYKELAFAMKEDAVLKINTDPALAEVLVNNLLRNAVFHSEKGQIEIFISSRSFSVANEGLKPLNPDLVFNRFQKSGSKSGTGLGLSIAKAICDLYGYTISYRYENSRHLFEVIL